MKRRFVLWIEGYFYAPAFFERFLSFLLFPVSAVYCAVVYLKYRFVKPREAGIKVVSVGNLTVGGSGKTPLVTAIARHFEEVAVVLRGYGRKSRGLRVVKNRGKLLCDVDECGDEAMVYATKLEKSIIIVSEDRWAGIHKAKALGANFVILDDGYSKHYIKKLDLLIEVPTPNTFCLPSGPFREKLWRGKKAVVLREERDFWRHTTLRNAANKMVLVTAIARPERLEKYLPKGVVSKYYFEDHHDFTKEEVAAIFEKEHPDSLLVTLKDYVKLERFGYPLSLLDLDIEISPKIIETIGKYIEGSDKRG